MTPPLDPRDVLELAAAAARVKSGRNDDDPEDEGLVHLVRMPPRVARTVAVPGDLPALLRSRLARAGVDTLYAHQAEALASVRAGQHTVIATGTASGKSLCYQLPVIEQLFADPRATALYLAPTKALARDQLRAIRELKLPQVRAAAIDGDTPYAERDAIRKTANLLLTNPDLLHHSVLPDHKHWAEVLHHLKFVIVDESHVARGVFGSHIALILRRLRRVAERYNADPTFILTTATIGNPGEHASALTGLDVVTIDHDGSPRGALDVGLWQPPMVDIDSGRRASLLRESSDLLAAFVAADVQTLLFAKSRKATELIARFTRETVGPERGERVRAYRGGYLADERRALEQALRDGDLLGVAATDALELGIDVSGLDAVILAGYPGTAASFWQRLGRAGRRGGAAIGVLVAGDDPLDRYLVTHPDQLLGRAPEDALIDATNPYLLAPHLRAAAQELPISDEEASRWFGAAAPALLAEDVDAGRLRRRGGRVFWIGRGRAAAEVDVRSSGGGTVRIVDTETGAVVGDVDGGRALSQVHDGAVYLHQGRTYVVGTLDLQRGVATVTHTPDVSYATRPRKDTDVAVLEIIERAPWGDVDRFLARVEVTNTVTGYERFTPGRYGPDAVTERIELDLPPTTLVTVAVGYTIGEDLLTDAGIAPARVPGSLHAAEHAAIGMLPLIALCDRWDIGGLSTALHPDTGLPTVFVYDGYPGGAGLAERSYRRMEEHLRATLDVVSSCPCRHGCPSCVQSPKCGNGNDPLDKRGAVQILTLLLDRAN